ncbi:MAG: mandelate racemase/muconate lactonizing enzyme family protein [Candidatus Latescibacteria bacterium]|jgi:galactonate dehydratase|nr:mandelate racemase/muconate lactonizing enzyme family protein [Candidatus Latescibacterota bacterium]
MKITEVKVHLVQSWRKTDHIASPWIFVQVYTDEGVVGLGDATNWPGGTIIKQAIDELGKLIIGEDPFNIELLYHRMYHALQQIGQTGVVIAAISGIEIALWDIVGKTSGQPIYNLIGGVCRDKIRFYSHASTPEECGRLAEKGVTAIKAYFPAAIPDNGEHITTPRSITILEEKQALEHMMRCREVVGDAVDIATDVGCRYSSSAAIRLGNRLEEVGLLFYEEPVSPENIEALARVTASVNVPVCVGERQYTRFGFRDMIASQAVDMIMPDVVRTGGIMESKKIASMAESYYMQVSPHNPNNAVSTVASLHLMANIPNALVLEYVDDEQDAPWRNDLLTDPPLVDNGYLRLPEKPGLGTELVMDVVNKYRFEG